jgi:hypothetical protein
MSNVTTLFLLIVLNVAMMSIGQQQVWTQRNPLPTSDGLYGIAYGYGTYVMVGSGGTIISSSNGTTWIRQRSGTNQWLRSVVWGNNQFVACGSGGAILTSPDGISWTSRESGAQGLSSLVWNGNIFLAVGWDRSIITSSDGILWTSRTSGFSNSIDNVAWGNNKFVASGWIGGTITSQDGISWSRGSADTSFYLSNILWANNQFVAIGRIGLLPRSSIYTSPDGVSWVRQIPDTSIYITLIAWNGSKFIATGVEDQTHLLFASADGQNWTETVSDYLNILCSLWDGTRFIAGGYSGSMMSSIDGITWVTQPLAGNANDLFDITWGNNSFVAVGRNGTIMTSADGTAWSCLDFVTHEDLSTVVWAENKFVALGTHGIILTSDNSTTWVNYSTYSSISFGKAIWDNNQYIAVADSGRIFTSDDGLSWEKRFSDTSCYFHGPYKCGSKLIVTGAYGTILTSSDGKLWTKQNSGTSNAITAALWNGKEYVCFVMDSDCLQTESYLVSQDAINWASHFFTWNFNATIYNVKSINGTFFAGGSDTPLLSSTDGINWKDEIPGTSNIISGFADNGTTLAAAGWHGTIITSPYPTSIKADNSLFNRQLSLSLRNNILSYKLDSPEHAIIKLYNISGCLLQTLVNNKMAAGTHIVMIPSQIAFGSYIVSLKTVGNESDQTLLFTKTTP